MKNMISVFLIAAMFMVPSAGFGYGDGIEDYYGETYEENMLKNANEETMGETQRLLDQRGGNLECIQCHGEPEPHEGVIETLSIVSETMEAALSCANWQIRGICIWLKCVGPVCAPITSVKVGNYVPEVVIQSYDIPDAEPWKESHDINRLSQAQSDDWWVMEIVDWVSSTDLDSLGIDSLKGGKPASGAGAKQGQRNVTFKLVDAYGNPAISAYNALLSSWGLFCKGKALMFYPYFISNLDSIGWRWNLPEVFYPMSWMASIKTWNLNDGLLNDYGSVYPRHGFAAQLDEFKVATTKAFTVGHIITRKNQAHVYFNIAQGSEDGYWGPGGLEKDDPKSGQFQMLYPVQEDSCRSFPYEARPASRRSTNGSYVWNMWRYYKCCKRMGQTLLFHTDVN
jgi:integrating conjugative element protein (TIGR03756 family)